MSKTTNLSALSDVVSVDGNGKIVAPGFQGTSYYHSATGQPDWYTANYQGDFYINGNGGDRLKIDSSGRVTMPYQPAFLGRDLGVIPSQSGIYSGFGTIDHNRGNHYNNSTGAFTCPVSGVYFFWANIRTNDNLSGRDESTRFVVNGSFQNWTEIWTGETYDASSGRAGHVNVMTMYLNTGDYVQMDLRNDTAMHAAFGGYLIG
jgi:hypothetical protein